jgi:branched-chain amino acid transport system permease protein
MGELLSALPRYGLHIAALGLLYASLATSWCWLRATGLIFLGHAAFFGAGALTEASLVTAAGISPWLALPLSAAAGALTSLPLVPALRLGPAGFGLASLAYAVLLKGFADNVPALGREGFLLPASPGFTGAEPPVAAALAALTLCASFGYRAFLDRPGGRAAVALRQAPETALCLGIGPIAARFRPLVFTGTVAAAAGALYAHLVGSIETSVVFSPTFSVLPLVLGMLGGALHPLGGIVGTLALYPLDEWVFRPTFHQAHTLAYGLALVGLLLARPDGLLKARVPRLPSSSARRPAARAPLEVAVRNLTVRRNGVAVLKDVRFVVEPGQILRVLGPNGAGKTSLLSAIAGRLPAAGTVLFGGAPAVRGAAARASSGVTRAFQTPGPFGEWTVRENVAMAAERSGNLEAVDELLERLDLTALAARPAGQLSVGEGKRLELARALAAKPAVLLLDEPLAGLTPAAASRVSAEIERERRRGAAIIWVEHGLDAVELSSQLLVLARGKTRFLGSPGEWQAARRATLA